ncbi:MAG TPA: iron donor protein CyaY [Kofleriaceae bacterium]|nr:iron donor protein CyaY [Kofleriaceae bacterium]
MDETTFDAVAHDEMAYLEERLGELDPDEVEVSSSAGVLRLDLRDGTKIVINSHRAARQIWMAAVATAWHFDPVGEGRWLASRTGEELRPTVSRLLRERIGIEITL